ncbi:glycerol-3-phosphate dehydrogenase/oxidase [Ammoniphilus sp. YIM 78166]|uniref:glycerol-3-phosphate dehydrogenase/oxidase n=1 Tax=Ammoniphilus sp. YIM 78166 TaxID=1644106 RepID=UPI001F0D8778|nr:glycerol-3-phosphate dehydrogenase/oxidase [Ammoniphilus sp. YIM 78166]
MSSTFSSLNRSNIISSLNHKQVDLIVIGGGITGSGIALDATTRGMETVVFEMQDFAAGTSSRSTKLVHGGLRYLKQFEVKMVAEVGKERAIVYENGPHVTTPEWMLLPIHAGGTFGKFSTSIGLRVYDWLAGVKRSEWRSMLNTTETITKEPLLKQDGLKGGGYYVEYRTDDARLTMEVMKEAVKRGATAVNYAKVEQFIYHDGKVVGVEVVDQITKKTYKVYAKKIVNAVGPWADSLREKDGSKKGKSLQLTKGVHLVFDQKRFPLKQAVYFDTPDGRMVFAIPRDGKTYVGTTDTVYKEDQAHPRMTKEDREYIINAINYMFPAVKVTAKDVESSWAGLRPLIHEDGKAPSEISRKDEIWVSESGLITIAGGKLTGYRKMAETVVNLLGKQLSTEGNSSYGPSMTKNMPISGGAVGGSVNFPSFIQTKVREGEKVGLDAEQAEKLVRRYGSNVDRLFELVTQYDGAAAASGLPVDLYAAVLYSIQEEMTVTPVDFFVRRTGALFFDINWVHQWKSPVIEFMASTLNWSAEEKARYTEQLEKHLHDAVVPSNEADYSKKKNVSCAG